MKTLILGLLLLSFNACASGSSGGWVVGNPVLPVGEGKAAAKKSPEKEKEDCVCKDEKATPPCECKKDEKKEVPKAPAETEKGAQPAPKARAK
jgi:hypothetical protein